MVNARSFIAVFLHIPSISSTNKIPSMYIIYITIFVIINSVSWNFL